MHYALPKLDLRASLTRKLISGMKMEFLEHSVWDRVGNFGG